MILPLLKVTLLAGLALVADQLLSRRGAALRHLLHATALLAVLLMTLTVAMGRRATPIPVPGSVRIVVDAVESPVFLSTQVGAVLSYWIPVLWFVGAVVFLLRLALGHALAQLAVGRGIPVSASMDGIAVAVIEADVPGPVVTGLLKPSILVPRNARDWPETLRSAGQRQMSNDLW